MNGKNGNGNGPGPDDSFDKRVAGIVRSELEDFLKKQLPLYMDQVIDAVKKQVLEAMPSDTDQIAELAAKKAMLKLNAQGEAFRENLEARADQASERVAADPGHPSAERVRPMTPGEKVVDTLTSDPFKVVDYAFGVWDRRNAKGASGDPFNWWKNLTVNRPDLAMYFAQSVVPDPLANALPMMLGKNTLDVYQLAFKQGLKAWQDQGSHPFSGGASEESGAYRRGLYGTQPESSDPGPDEPPEQSELTMASLFEG